MGVQVPLLAHLYLRKQTFERELGTMAHKFTVDEVSLCRRNIQFTVDSPTVDAAFGLRLAEAKAEVALPGYRKGKVPTGLIEKRFGKQIAQQVRDQLINQTLQEAIGAKKC